MLKRKWSVQSLSFNQHVTFLLVASNSDFHLKCGNLGGDWSVVLQPPRNNVRECSKSFCGKWIWRRVYKLYLIYEHLGERMDWSLSPYYELSCLGIGLMNSSGSYTDAEDQQPSETSTFAFLRRWAVVWELSSPRSDVYLSSLHTPHRLSWSFNESSESTATRMIAGMGISSWCGT